MDDIDAPAGGPPPKVPDGWQAKYNDKYSEWFYINTVTKKSQWDKPTEPVYPPQTDGAPEAPPPKKEKKEDKKEGKKDVDKEEKKDAKDNKKEKGSDVTKTKDLADSTRELNLNGGASDKANYQPPQMTAQQQYENTPMPPGYENQMYGQPSPQPQPSKGGARGLFDRFTGGSPQPQPQPQQWQQQYQPSPQGQNGYIPPPDQHMYQQQPNYGYPPPQQQQPTPPPAQEKAAKKKGGMGFMGKAALGLGGGLVGGMVLTDVIKHHDKKEREEGYENGYGQGYDQGDNEGRYEERYEEERFDDDDY
jgi:hypothetical protein